MKNLRMLAGRITSESSLLSYLRSYSQMISMRNTVKFAIGCVTALFGAIALLLAETVAAEGSDDNGSIAIVVHKDTGVDNLSLADLRSIFLAEQQFWEDRTRIILLVRAPQSDERDFVLNSIYQMSEAQFRQYWIAKMFRSCRSNVLLHRCAPVSSTSCAEMRNWSPALRTLPWRR